MDDLEREMTRTVVTNDLQGNGIERRMPSVIQKIASVNVNVNAKKTGTVTIGEEVRATMTDRELLRSIATFPVAAAETMIEARLAAGEGGTGVVVASGSVTVGDGIGVQNDQETFARKVPRRGQSRRDERA